MGLGIFSKHPPGLMVLFNVEAWERFAYYGMRALLILHMTAPLASGGMGLEVGVAGATYGVFTAAVYLMSLPGGWVADKLIGHQRAVLFGGVLIGIGNLLLGIPAGIIGFAIALGITAVGVGLLKPNVSAMVGELYIGRSSATRDAGFSIFYCGIYLGAFLSPLVAGTMGEAYGYRIGFAVTGVAMLLGTVAYRLSWRRLGPIGRPVVVQGQPKHRVTGAIVATVAMSFCLVTAAITMLGLTIEDIAAGMGVLITAVLIFFIGNLLAGNRLNSQERKHVYVILILCACAALFTAGLEQAGSTMNLFARDYTDRSALGGLFANGEHPAAWYQSISPSFVLLLTPLFAYLWTSLGSRGLDPSAPLKFGISLVIFGGSFAVMALAVMLTVNQGVKAGPEWLVLVYLLQTIAELTISPIGLSAVTKLSPRGHSGQMMGLWFLAAAAGSLAAGLLGGWMGSAQIAEIPGRFLVMAGTGAAAGLAMIILAPKVRGLIEQNPRPIPTTAN